MRLACQTRLMRAAVVAGLGVLAGADLARGQEQTTTPASPPVATTTPAEQDALPVLTLDRERLFTGTKFGKAVIARFEADAKTLQTENRRIDAALEAEERALTERRATVPAEEFRALAADFDSRVEKLRSAQDAKSRDLVRQRDEARQQFYETALPVLGQLMSDHGALAIIDRGALIVSFDRIDITDDAITRIDEVLGDGSARPQPAGKSAPPTAGGSDASAPGDTNAPPAQP